MEESKAKAKQYSKIKIRLTITRLILMIVFLVIMLLTGASVYLRQAVSGWSGNFYVQAGLYLVIFSFIYYAVFIGMDFYSGYILEHRFELSNQTIGGWLKRSAKAEVLSLIMLLITGEGIYFLLKNSSNYWWLWATAGWLVLTLVIGKIAPTLIIPLFYKCTPIKNAELKERLLNLGKKCRVKIGEVFDIGLSKETKKANAAVVGWGMGRRILIGDTLSKNYTEDEIEAVFAHELGHIREHHTWKITGAGILCSLVSFYITFLVYGSGVKSFSFENAYDVAAFPLLSLILMVVGLVLVPLQNGFSRHLEKQADIFGAEHINDKQYLISSLAKMGEQNLSDPDPSRLVEFFFYDHPPIPKRLNYLGLWERKISGENS
jgi:STE24 endopeptidase